MKPAGRVAEDTDADIARPGGTVRILAGDESGLHIGDILDEDEVHRETDHRIVGGKRKRRGIEVCGTAAITLMTGDQEDAQA